MEQAGLAQRRRILLEVGVLGALVGAETLVAARAFPQLDDAYLLLLLKERGAEAIAQAHPDRPLVGALWQGLAGALGAGFWPVGFALHFVLWLALGILSCMVWRRIFPRWERYAIVAGLVAVTPIVVRTQFSTVTISLLCVLSVVVAWSSVLLAWRFVAAPGAAALVAALLLSGAAAAFSEYGALSTFTGAALILAAFWADPARRARASAAAGSLGAVALAGYAVYVRVADFSARPLVDPMRQLKGSALWTRVPPNVATRFWDALVGDLCRVAASFQLEWQSKSTLAALLAGMLVGAAVWLATGERDASDRPAGTRRGFLALAAALAIGLLPIALMRPVFRTAFASRFELPVLPVAASGSVALVLIAVNPRFLRLAVAGLGFLAGVAVAREASEALRQRTAMRAIASVLEPIVRARAGVTLAVLSDTGLCHTAQVCTGAVSKDWPAELGRRLWVETAEEARAALGRRGACIGTGIAGLSERGFERGLPGQAPLWVDDAGRAPRLEPYCSWATDHAPIGVEVER